MSSKCLPKTISSSYEKLPSIKTCLPITYTLEKSFFATASFKGLSVVYFQTVKKRVV